LLEELNNSLLPKRNSNKIKNELSNENINVDSKLNEVKEFPKVKREYHKKEKEKNNIIQGDSLINHCAIHCWVPPHCCLCRENTANCAFKPCGHLRYCSDCARCFKICPLCKAEIIAFRNILFS
ncbi:MAG: hypothetical protein MJ252_12800, partial [archaeon]|nr:hypothetical protein [archaeon]